MAPEELNTSKKVPGTGEGQMAASPALASGLLIVERTAWTDGQALERLDSLHCW